MWVTVREVHRSDGADRHGELAWASENIGNFTTKYHAVQCAVDWFDDTDQSEECELTMRVERPDGSTVDHRIIVKITPHAHIVDGDET